jgi:hypothetical protein
MGWTAGVRFLAEESYFLYSTTSRPTPEPTQPPIQWVLGAVSPRLKWPGRVTDNLPPSSAKVKNVGAIPPLPQYVFMTWCSIGHREHFTFYLYIIHMNMGLNYHS